MSDKLKHQVVFLIGAGPAGLFCAQKLALANIQVLLLNRDIKPGGLAEYGIFPNKYTMKEGLRKQFRKILSHPNIHYFGNVTVGGNQEITLEKLHALQPNSIMVAAGAQGTKFLGIEGESQAKGVFQAKDLVYHYNILPPFSAQNFPVGKRVGIIGLGNVMCDIANYCCNMVQAQEVFAIGRRGPGETKYTNKEFETFSRFLDREKLLAEFARIESMLETAQQNPQELYEKISSHAPSDAPHSPTRFWFRFFSTPNKILLDEHGRIRALEVINNTYVREAQQLKLRATQQLEELPMDTLVMAIGDTVDENLGLPFTGGQFITNSSATSNESEGHLYEVFDAKLKCKIPGWFVCGWSRIASDGLVGKARKDGEKGAQVVLDYLTNQPSCTDQEWQTKWQQIQNLLTQLKSPAVSYKDVQSLEKIEQYEAQKKGVPEFKFASNAEMLTAIRSNAL